MQCYGVVCGIMTDLQQVFFLWTVRREVQSKDTDHRVFSVSLFLRICMKSESMLLTLIGKYNYSVPASEVTQPVVL